MGVELLAKHEHSGADPHLYARPPAPLDRHPLFAGGPPSVGLMSGDNPLFPGQVHGHEALVQHLQKMGLQFSETHGHYGAPERSVVIHGPSRQQMYHLGKTFGQEAVIWSRRGQHELLYTNGPDQGLYHPSLPRVRFHATEAPPDYWTHLPGHGFTTLYFDMDRKLPAMVYSPSPGRTSLPGPDYRAARMSMTKAEELLKAMGPVDPTVAPARYPHVKRVGPGVLVKPADLGVAPEELGHLPRGQG